MTIVYALVSREKTVLAEYTATLGKIGQDTEDGLDSLTRLFLFDTVMSTLALTAVQWRMNVFCIAYFQLCQVFMYQGNHRPSLEEP